MHTRKQQEGVALMVVMLAMSFVVGTLMIALTFAQYSGDVIARQLTYQGQAVNVANAGLTEGLDWFRRQTTQPVSTFTPTINTTVTPPINDTDTVTTPAGIVREFEISDPGRVWGRYVVQINTASPGYGVLDLSKSRGKLTGTVWQLESTGTIYVHNSNTAAYNVSPNFVLAKKTIRTEIQRLSVVGQGAALLIGVGNKVTDGPYGRCAGGSQGIGVIFKTGTAPVISGNGKMTGKSAYSTSPTLDLTIPGVFGLTQNELYQIADIYVTSAAQLPNPLPPMQLIVVDVGAGTAAFGNGTVPPLVGSGILFVKGNLSLDDVSNWNGIIYVLDGNYTQTGPATVSGSCIINSTSGLNTALLSGSSDFADLTYDPFIISQVAQQMGLYRQSRTPYLN